MYRALATYSIWETCRQANVNVPTDARHSDSIRKLGKIIIIIIGLSILIGESR